jgi:hypothetical protein
LYNDLYPVNEQFGIDDVIAWWDTKAKGAGKGQ